MTPAVKQSNPEDMQFANEAFDILGFSEEMKYNVCMYVCIGTYIVLHLVGEAKNVEGLISKLHVLLVVDGR